MTNFVENLLLKNDLFDMKKGELCFKKVGQFFQGQTNQVFKPFYLAKM